MSRFINRHQAKRSSGFDMIRRPSALLPVWLAVATLPAFGTSSPQAAPADHIVAFVEKHCAECHVGAAREGEVSLDGFQDETSILEARKTWTRALEQVRTGAMPPKDHPRPPFDDAERFTKALQVVFEKFDRTAPRDPGTVIMRRLNRAEYVNTVRDLVGVNIPLGDDFPPDEPGYGFDNVGEMLTLSPTLLDRYLAAADAIVRAAILEGEPPKPPSTSVRGALFYGTPYGPGYDPKTGSLMYDAEGKWLPPKERIPSLHESRKVFYDQVPARYEFDGGATGGEGTLVAKLQGHLVGPDPPQFALLVGDKEVFRGVCSDKEEEFRVPVRLAPGRVDVGISLLNEFTDPENPRGRRGIILLSMTLVGPSIPGSHEQLFGGSEHLTGDDRSRFVLERFATRAWRRPVAREEIDRLLQIVHEAEKVPVLFSFLTGPESLAALQAAQVPEDVISMTRHLHKRPFVDEERFLSDLKRRMAPDQFRAHGAAILGAAEKQPAAWEGQIGLAIRAVLCSPHFLYRVEIDDQPQAKGPRPLEDFQLASRLSYFLWSSMPDQELFDLAARRQLHQQLPAQVKRMLADLRSKGLADNFAMQWLGLRQLDEFTPAPEVLGKPKAPGSWADLRGDMLNETGMFFMALVREDRSIFDLFDAPFTFVNQRLAELYDIGDTNGNSAQPKAKPVNPPGAPIPSIVVLDLGQDGLSFTRSRNPFVRVNLENTPRGGLLTQASVLAVTSHPKRTSPVKRGDWVLSRILGTPPPPPPPNVPGLEEVKHDASLSLRQQTEIHRKEPSCAGCHARIDPIGFGLENFDPLGRYREKDGELAIDAGGELPGGRTFTGVGELKQILKGEKDLLGRHLVESMLIYATGRGLDVYDRRTVDEILATAAKQEHRFQSVITAIVQSDAFRLRRGVGSDGSTGSDDSAKDLP